MQPSTMTSGDEKVSKELSTESIFAWSFDSMASARPGQGMTVIVWPGFLKVLIKYLSLGERAVDSVARMTISLVPLISVAGFTAGSVPTKVILG